MVVVVVVGNLVRAETRAVTWGVLVGTEWHRVTSRGVTPKVGRPGVPGR